LGAAELDWQLRDVPCPEGLLGRIQRIVEDEELDDWIRDLPSPTGVVARAHNIPYRRNVSRLTRWALAASLLVAVSAAYFSTLGGLLFAMRPPSPKPMELLVIDRGPLDLDGPPEELLAITLGPPAVPEGDVPAPLPSATDEVDLLPVVDRLALGPAGILASEWGRRWDPTHNWLLARWSVLGYSQPEATSLAPLDMIPLPVAAGLELPLRREFDREFLFSRGTHPPVLTSLGKATHECVAPLATDTTSWDLTRRAIAAGRLPGPEALRVEDFLAAVAYPLPSVPPGDVGIRVAAGPSVFHRRGAGLLQVGVKAGRPPVRALPATHLTVAVDLSASREWDGRFDQACQGVMRALAHLEPQDRLTLVVCGESPFVPVREARPDDADRLIDSLERLRPAGGGNLAGALQLAVATALEVDSDAGLAKRLVVITDSRPEFSVQSADATRQMLREAVPWGFRLEVLDLSEGAATAWTDLAAAGGGQVRRVHNAADIRWALVESLTGEPSLAASETRLQVRFNPQAVAAYRLIGHEATGVGGTLPGSVQADLHVGEQASVLFEIWLYPNDEEDVGFASLQWTEQPGGAARRQGPQRISRVQFAASWEGTPLALQEAAVVAEAAEILRQSFGFDVPAQGAYRYEPKPGRLDEVLQRCRQVSPQLARRSDYQRFVSWLERAQPLLEDRPPAQARAGARGIVSGRWREFKD
jgi:Ca-activated chloride channel family protein